MKMYETDIDDLIDTQLKPLVRQRRAEMEGLNAEIDEISNNLLQLDLLGRTPENLSAKVTFDIGEGFKMQSTIDTPFDQKISLLVGKGIYVEFSIIEAADFLQKQLAEAFSKREKAAMSLSSILVDYNLAVVGQSNISAAK